MQQQQAKQAKLCNCARGPTTCPVKGKCLLSSLIYRATIRTAQGDTYQYIGQTAKTFKQRLTGHRQDHHDSSRRHNTSLAAKVWDLRDRGITHQLTWEIIQQAREYCPVSKTCRLCLAEKLMITTAAP